MDEVSELQLTRSVCFVLALSEDFPYKKIHQKFHTEKNRNFRYERVDDDLMRVKVVQPGSLLWYIQTRY